MEGIKPNNSHERSKSRGELSSVLGGREGGKGCESIRGPCPGGTRS